MLNAANIYLFGIILTKYKYIDRSFADSTYNTSKAIRALCNTFCIRKLSSKKTFFGPHLLNISPFVYLVEGGGGGYDFIFLFIST